jgi:hypothetical protein
LNVVPLDQSYGALMGLLTWRNFTALAALPGAQIDTEASESARLARAQDNLLKDSAPWATKPQHSSGAASSEVQ